MRVQGTFLTSRAGRRIFWTLLLAAAVPLALFGVAMHALLSAQFDSQMQRQQLQLTKFAGMGLLDRLLVARTALDITARTGRVTAEADADSRSGRVLAEVAQVDARGRAVSGSAALARRWREQTSAWLAQEHNGSATVVLGAENTAGSARPLLLLIADPSHRYRAWIAEVESAFLFSELSSDASGWRICVFDRPWSPIHCPGWTASDASTLWNDATGLGGTRWNLFLRSDFGVDDWILVSMDAPNEHSASAPLARMSALVAAVTLLFVGMLGMIQVRRTMVPLERLIAGTRRLSEHDYGARVDLRPGDEFGELAQSFNHMAERVGHQMQALQVQSSIDREILNGLNVSRVLQRVAQRLEQLMPGASACVVELDRSSRMLARVHHAAGPVSVTSLPRTDALSIAQLASEDTLRHDEPPPWLRGALPIDAPHLWLRCARAADEPLGLLVIATDRAALAAEVEREIIELCDRVSVTLTSADRERRLLERATHDGLTGLANRAGLYEWIEAHLVDARRSPFSVLFMDLDRFKEVNDALGHQAGDELLRAFASRLQRLVPAGALVARPGGDEFVLLVRGPRAAADELAPALCRELGQPIEVAGRPIVVGVSIGIAHFPDHGVSSSDLLRRADMAMYAAKARGGGVAAWFEPALDVQVTERASLVADLRQALARHELEVHYQPRIQSRSRTTVSGEALLRWRHPQRGLVPAPAFVPLLEETGLIDVVGLWVIEQALGQLSRWRAQGLRLQSIAVNVSTRQLHSTHLPEQLAQLIRRFGLQPGDLELEVTESIFMGDAAVPIRTLQVLHDAGIHIALDDFGTGYSSLSYLHKLPIGILKVDRSFVSELGQRDSALALTRSIVTLARTLHLRVVAEGVETQHQADLLVALGCDELQGYLYAPALEPSDFAAHVAREARESAAFTA